MIMTIEVLISYVVKTGCAIQTPEDPNAIVTGVSCVTGNDLMIEVTFKDASGDPKKAWRNIEEIFDGMNKRPTSVTVTAEL